jgi:hypothetical protein
VSDVYFSFFNFSFYPFSFFVPFLFLSVCVYIYNYTLDYVHARPASLGTVQLIMSNSYCFYGSLDTDRTANAGCKWTYI